MAQDIENYETLSFRKNITQADIPDFDVPV